MTNCQIDHKALAAFCRSLLEAEGVPAPEAAVVVDVLVEASLCGVDSHGVSRMREYLERLRSGGCRRVAEITVLRDFPAGASWDAQGSFGPVVGEKAMLCAIEKAQTVGVGFVTVRGGNHTGANAHYARMAASRGMIGLVAGNGPPMVAPWGSATPFFSTNPISFGVPVGDDAPPVIIDMATSVSARGKIILAVKEGRSIPQGWAMDAEGNDTTDAAAAMKGALLPFGGHKGYAIAFMVEVLAGILSGSGYGPKHKDHYGRFDSPMNSGNLFAAVDIGKFLPPDEFACDMREMTSRIRAGKVRPGFERIMLPGDVEEGNRARRLGEGIPLSPAVEAELRAEGETYGVPFPGCR